MKILTLKEFIASKVWSDNGQGYIGQYDRAVKGFVYGNESAKGFIESGGGYYHLFLDRSDYKSVDLEDLERRLYVDHYLVNAGIGDIIDDCAHMVWDVNGTPVAPLQDLIGQDDGGFASIWFSDSELTKDWNDPTPEQEDKNSDVLREYLEHEVMGYCPA